MAKENGKLTFYIPQTEKAIKGIIMTVIGKIISKMVRELMFGTTGQSIKGNGRKVSFMDAEISQTARVKSPLALTIAANCNKNELTTPLPIFCIFRASFIVHTKDRTCSDC